MSVNDKSAPSESQQPINQNTQTQAPYGQGNTQSTGEKIGMGNINTVWRRSGSVDQTEGRSAEALRALQTATKEMVEVQDLANDFELFRFDRDDNRVGLPSILVVKSATTKIGKVFAIRVLLLETEGLRLRPRIVHQNGQRIEVPSRAQDVFTDHYWNQIVAFVSRNKGVQPLNRTPNGVHIVDAGALLVPASFEFISKTGVMVGNSVQHLLVTSVNRCDDIIARTNNETPFTIANVKRSDERLTASVNFTGGDAGVPPSTNVVGVPIRSDMVISMDRRLSTNIQTDEFYENESELNRVSGFVNLEYTPPQNPVPMAGGWGQPQQPPQMFTPTFVITDVSQASWIQAQTLELYLLALSNAYRATAGTQWARTFLPNVGVKGVDTRDIGAVGYMMQNGPQPGQKIDTKSSKFTEENFVELMTMTVRSNLAFMIDINPMGDHAANENYLLDAAFDGPNKARAKERLIQAANNLTGGAFSQFFDSTKDIVAPMGQVHLGSYLDEAGEKRDIRDLDVLAALNLTQGNMQEFSDWYMTFTNMNDPIELRLLRREKFERSWMSKNMTITGRATRLMINPAFIESFDEACRVAGLQVDFENITSIMNGQRFTGNQVVNQYITSRNATYGFGSGSNTTVNNNSMYTGMSGRIW